MDFDGVAFKARREALGFTQDELGQIIGVKRATISAWECGKIIPRRPESLTSILGGLEDRMMIAISRCFELADAEEQLNDAEELIFHVYRDDETFAASEPDLVAQGLNAFMHRRACAIAAMILEEDGFIVRLADGAPKPR